MTKKKSNEKSWFESGQRWAYPLGDGRWIAVQITEVIDDGPAVALAFDGVFDGVPTAAQLDAAPWLHWDIGPIVMGLPARGIVARFGLGRHPISPRAVLVDTTAIRDATELGPANVPSCSSLAAVSLRVWQHWHHRSVTGAWGHATLDRPHQLRWQGVRGAVEEQLARLRDQPPPLVLSVGECSLGTVDLSAISAQAIVLDAGRGFRGREVVLPAHVHTLAVWGRHSIARVICQPNSAPLELSLQDGGADRIAGLDRARVVCVGDSSGHGVRGEALASWTHVEELCVWSQSVSAFAGSYELPHTSLAALQSLTLGGMTNLDAERLPPLALLPALRLVHVDSACKAITAIRQRYGGQAMVVRYSKSTPSHSPMEHQITATL